MKKPKPSGSERRRNERAEQEAAEREQAGAMPSQFDYHGGAQRFAALGEPDYEQAETALEFARRYLLESLYQIGNDVGLKARDRHRMLKDAAIALGATHPRASIEQKFRRLADARKKQGESPANHLESVRGIKRPPTARNYRPDEGDPEE